MNLLNKILPVLVLVFSLPSAAQDLTGVWTGYIETPETRLDYELSISDNGKKMNGFSLMIYEKDGVENSGVKKVMIRQRKESLFLDDGELILDNYTLKPMRMKLSSTLRLSTEDSLMKLTGTFKTRSLDMRDQSNYEGRVFLQKRGRFVNTKLIAKLDELKLVQELSFLPGNIRIRLRQEERNANKPQQVDPVIRERTNKTNTPVEITLPPVQTEIIKEIQFSSDSLQLSLVDNGTIDGDTVSLVLNGQVILSNVALRTIPIRLNIAVPSNPGDSLLLVMVAENLGALPPNTGLLTIMDGDTRYDIRFQGDLQKSSAIVLRRK